MACPPCIGYHVNGSVSYAHRTYNQLHSVNSAFLVTFLLHFDDLNLYMCNYNKVKSHLVSDPNPVPTPDQDAGGSVKGNLINETMFTCGQRDRTSRRPIN